MMIAKDRCLRKSTVKKKVKIGRKADVQKKIMHILLL